MHFLTILAGSLAIVAASPFPEPTGDVQKRAAASCRDNAVYKTLSAQGAKGTDFCFEYLHLPTTVKEVPGPKKTITVPGIKTVTLAPPCDDYVKREAAAEPEAAAEDADALGKRQLLPAVQALAADKISKGCQCLSLGTKTVTKTKYDITLATKVIGTVSVCPTDP